MNASLTTACPTGREKLAQGEERSDDAAGNPRPNTLSPGGAKKTPAGWKFVRLGEVAKTTSGGTPRRDRPQFYGGNIPWVKSGELGDSVVYETEETITEEAIKSSNAKIFPKGTLCIALYGATVGKLGILGIDAATNQAVCAIFPPEGLDTKYLYRFFESKRRELVEQGKGGAQANISQGIIRDTVIPLPATFEEQRRIVAEIEKQFTRVEAGVAALRRVQANLKRYRAAVLKAACEGKLVPTEAELTAENAKSAKKNARSVSAPSANSAVKIAGYETGEQLLQRILAERRKNWTGRGKHKEPAAPDTANLPPLPEGWTWASIEQITENFDGRRVPLKSADRDKRSGQYPYYGASGIIDDIDDFLFDGEFLLIAEDGANLLSRSTPIAFKASGKFWVNNHAHIVQTHGGIPLSYLATFLNGKDLTFSITGSAQPKLTQAAMNKIQIPLPPLAEQTRIVTEVERRLSVVEELESMVSANLQRATRLRQSILQKAFTGKLL